MKKIFTLVLTLIMSLILSASLFATGQASGAYGSVAGLNSKVSLITGAYTLVGAQITYNSITYTSNQIFLLEDAANTYTAAAQTITFTAIPLTNGANTAYFNVGNIGFYPNGSGRGLWSGTKFSNGVVLDAGPVGVTISVSLSGK